MRTLLTHPRPRLVAHAQFTTGTLDGRDVVVVGSGMGKVNGAVIATVLADRFGCTTLLFSGVAGGLDPDLNIGDVVIADRVVQHDAGLVDDAQTHVYQAGHVPFINPTDRLGYRVHPELLKRVAARLDGYRMAPLSAAAGGNGRTPRIAYGTVLTGDQYVHSESVRHRLHREFNGRAVEMEGGAIAQVAESFGIPWLVIRGLSDLAGRDSRFDFLRFVEEVAETSAGILRHLLPVI